LPKPFIARAFSFLLTLHLPFALPAFAKWYTRSMNCLSDLFAYMYAADLETLERVVPETARILAERKREAAQQRVAGVSEGSKVVRLDLSEVDDLTSRPVRDKRKTEMHKYGTRQ
jgi:hypothetical protein